MKITEDDLMVLYRNPNARVSTDEDAPPLTRDDVIAVINSYIESGGEVTDQGLPTTPEGMETVLDQLNSSLQNRLND